MCSASSAPCTCIDRSSRPPNAPPTPARWIRTCSSGETEARRDLRAVDVQPLRRDVDVDAAFAVRHREARLRPEERLILDPDLVDALDADVARRLGIAVADHHVPHDVRAVVLAVAVAAGRPLGMQIGLLGRALHVGDRLERLVVDDDPLGGAARLLGMLGRDERDRLAVVEHAVDRQHRLVCELEPVRLLAGDVVVREHGVDARHRRPPRRCRSTRMRACACGLRSVWPQSIPGTIRSLAYANSPFTFGGASTRGTSSPTLPTCSCLAAVRVMPAASRTASKIFAYPVQRQRLPESASRISSSDGLGAAPEQIDGRDDEPRRAEAALHCAGVDERLLHGVQPLAVGKPLDGRHVVAVGLRGEHEARADERAVEQHRARAALALLARVLRAREPELLAQREEQRLALPAVGLLLLAVDPDGDPHTSTRFSARSVSTRSACLR